MRKLPAPEYDSTPVIGYGEGLIKVRDPWTQKPERVVEHFPDNRGSVANDWFTIEDTRYNVHPYRADLGGWPVRWKEAA